MRVILLILCLSCALAWAGAETLQRDDILRAVKNGELPPPPQLDDPDYPIYIVLKGFLEDQKSKGPLSIDTLESLLRKQLFQGQLPKNTKNAHFRLYGNWRDLTYVILGRAYYESGDLKRSLQYLTGFPKNSPFAEVAQLQRAWALLKLGDYAAARAAKEELKTMKSSRAQRLLREMDLQEAFYLLKSNDYDGCLKIVDTLKFETGTSLEDLRYKMRAQALFSKYERALKESFEVRTKLLRASIEAVEQVTPAHRDSHYAYFAAEAYWQMASQLRVQDPVKLANESLANLKKADAQIGTWAEKSISEKHPYITEDAMFLSAVVLWEAKRFDEAIPRLLSTITLFPKTEYREDIFQLVGDHYYGTGQFQKALPHYTALAASGLAEKATYGLYKAAWTFYNLDEKYKAMRHLERLVRYYRKNAATASNAGSISKEAEKDMLLLLAETLPVNDATAELDALEYKGEEWFEVREMLATTYGKLGKNVEAVEVWKRLLDRASEHPSAERWLAELLQSHLNAAQRLEIAKSFDHYKSVKSVPAVDGVLVQKVIRVQLTLHREGSKTDDVEVWKAADALYEVVTKYLPHLPSGDFWYFGAQRKEKLEQHWLAVAWYEKAALMKGYENADDAAVSVVRIAKRVMDEMNNYEMKKDAAAYQPIIESTAWFLENQRARPERPLAERLHLEALYRAADFTRAREYISKESARADKSFWPNLAYFTHFLYDSKQWEYLYTVSNEILLKTNPPEEFKEKIEFSRGESSFERAFELEAANETKSLARTWYERCIQVARPRVRLKAWHNRLLTWDVKTQADEASRDYEQGLREEFQKGVVSPTADDKKLLFEIHIMGANAYRAMHKRSSRAQSLLRAASWNDEKEAKAELQWEALMNFAADYDLDNYFQLRKKFLAVGEMWTETRRVADGRVLFLLGKKKEALENIAPLMSKLSISIELLVRDVLTSDPSFAPWVLERERALKNSTPLESFWARRSLGEIEGSLKLKSLAAPTIPTPQVRDAASVTPSDPAEMLKARLSVVVQTLKTDVDDRKLFKVYFSSPYPQLRVRGLCRLPVISKATISQLSRLKEPAIDLPQWKDFISKLTQKIAELEGAVKKEELECDKKLQEIALYDPLDARSSPLCSNSVCPTAKLLLPADLQTYYAKSTSNGVTRVNELIALGAWITAEEEALLISDSEEKKVALSIIRLAENDRWAAASILQTVQSDKWKPEALNLLDRIRKSSRGPSLRPLGYEGQADYRAPRTSVAN